jgi:hypothetical protein
MRIIHLVSIVAGVLSLWVCSPVNHRAVFEFAHPGDGRGPVTLVAITDKPEIIEKARAELAKAPGQRRLHINGQIARGDGAHNQAGVGILHLMIGIWRRSASNSVMVSPHSWTSILTNGFVMSVGIVPGLHDLSRNARQRTVQRITPLT